MNKMVVVNSSHITEYPHYDKPSTGMFAVALPTIQATHTASKAGKHGCLLVAK